MSEGAGDQWTPALETVLPRELEKERRQINRQACEIARLFWLTGWGASWLLHADAIDFTFWRDLDGQIWSNHVILTFEALRRIAIPRARLALQVWKQAQVSLAEAVLKEFADD